MLGGHPENQDRYFARKWCALRRPIFSAPNIYAPVIPAPTPESHAHFCVDESCTTLHSSFFHHHLQHMSWQTYTAAALATLLALVYGTVIFFSHNPRAATASELKYQTNDGKGPVHSLPPAASSKATSEASDAVLSVVVPCYNETARLGVMLDEAVAYLQKELRSQYEIVIVDDGSSDGTAGYALKKAEELGLAPHVVKVVRLATNRGKGGAVTHGIRHGRGKYLLFADADGATRFSDAGRLLAFLQEQPTEKPAIAIGLRAHMVNTDAVVQRTFVRNLLMYGLHALVFVFGIRKVQDTQCGFKMFNREAVRMVFPHMHTERWIFDVEILLLAGMQGVEMKEIPVSWQEIDGSKVDLARDLIQMAVDLVVTRMAYLLGVYGLNECGRKA